MVAAVAILLYLCRADTEKKTQTEIRAAIDQHLREKAKVEATLPQSIIIGPFHINTDSTRIALAEKHRDIATALLQYLVVSLQQITEEVIVVLG